MAFLQPRHPINLGLQSLQLGLPVLPGQQGKPGPIPLGAGQPADSNAAIYGIAEAMATDPISIESGTFAEGLAEGLERFMTTRAATQRARAEEADEARQRKREEGAEEAERQRQRRLGEALRTYSGSGDANALVGALSDVAPEEALDLATVLMRQRAQQEPDEQWSEPYMLNGVLVQRNERTGQIRQAVSRPPVARAGGGPYPDDGYDYD